MVRQLGGTKAVLTGTAVVGSADALDALLFFVIRNGTRPGRIFQGIASGLLGPASFRGGTATVALGVLLHYTIAFGIVVTYFLASRKIDVLRRRRYSLAFCTGLRRSA
jgi:hypothetical protein